jgi:hypothetical protein
MEYFTVVEDPGPCGAITPHEVQETQADTNGFPVAHLRGECHHPVQGESSHANLEQTLSNHLPLHKPTLKLGNVLHSNFLLSWICEQHRLGPECRLLWCL